MAITRTAMVDDDGSGTTGTIINNAWKQELYGQIDGLAGGAWIAMPPLSYTSSGGVWTPATIIVNTYRILEGNVIVWQFSVNPVTYPAAASLTISGFPFSLSSTTQVNAIGLSKSPCYLQVSNATSVAIVQTSFAPWPAETGHFYWTAVLRGA